MSRAPSDSALLREARRGDREAFTRLVERHYPLLLIGCRRMLRDSDLAHEAAQEAVVRSMLGLDGLRDDSRFGAWLVGIGLNVCRSLLAARRRRAAREAPLDADGRQNSPPGADLDPAAIVQTREHVFLGDAAGRRLAIWIGLPEATALAIALERVDLPRPGVYQFTSGLLAAAGSAVREVHVTELTDSTFYARTILADGTAVDSRPSDAITLAVVTGARILVAETVLAQVARERDSMLDLEREAEAAPDDARTIADEARRRWTEAAEDARERRSP